MYKNARSRPPIFNSPWRYRGLRKPKTIEDKRKFYFLEIAHCSKSGQDVQSLKRMLPTDLFDEVVEMGLAKWLGHWCPRTGRDLDRENKIRAALYQKTGLRFARRKN